MSSYTLTDAGLVTSDPVIAAMFLEGQKIDFWNAINEWFDGWLARITWRKECPFETTQDVPYKKVAEKIRIPRSLVWAAIQPVEGEGCVVDSSPALDDENLRVLCYPNPLTGSKLDVRFYHKRVLNLVTTRAELRELVAKCQPAVSQGEKDE